MTITPAYGRDYKSKAEILADWNANKDFTLQHMGKSTYINKEDAEREKLLSFQVRYKQLRSAAILKYSLKKGWTC